MCLRVNLVPVIIINVSPFFGKNMFNLKVCWYQIFLLRVKIRIKQKQRPCQAGRGIIPQFLRKLSFVQRKGRVKVITGTYRNISVKYIVSNAVYRWKEKKLSK
jgi:hypothetical protein